MSIRYDERNKCWRWEFDKIVAGKRLRLSRLLQKSWSETQARRYDDAETARILTELTSGRAPLIERAVALYVEEHLAGTKDRVNAGRHLSKLIPFFQGHRLNELGTVSREYIKATKGELAPATIKQRLALLQAAANYALKHHGMGKVEWIAQMTMPSVKNDRAEFLTRAQVLRVARACKCRGTRALVLMTFATGSRPGECHRSQREGDSHLLIRQKNGTWERKPVPPWARRYLRHWPMRYGYSYYSERFREARAAVGLDHIHPHDLRHSTASVLIKDGASLRQVGLVLGHKTAQATARYTHLADEEKRRLLEGLGRKVPHN